MELSMVSVPVAPVVGVRSVKVVGAGRRVGRLCRRKLSNSGQAPVGTPVHCSSRGYPGKALKQDLSERHVVRALATEMQATPQSNGDSSTDGWSHALAVSGSALTSREGDAGANGAVNGAKDRSEKPKRDARGFTPLEKLQWTTSMPEYMQSCPDELLLGDSWLYSTTGGIAPPSPSTSRYLSLPEATNGASFGGKLDTYIPAVPAVKWGSSTKGPQYGPSEIPPMRLDPVWRHVVEEARTVAAEEPFLCTNMHGCILDHDCLEKSLAFILSNQLSNEILLPTQLMELFLDVLASDEDIRVAIREDAKAVVTRDPACQKYIHAILYMKGYHAVQAYRIAHHLYKKGRHVLAYMLQSLISQKLGLDIHPAARIGHGVLMDHGMGIVIGETAVVGEMCSLMQGVTLGGTGKDSGDRHPKLGHGVLVSAHATILGNIQIGTGSMIAAGSLVLKNVERRTIVAGNPARVVGVKLHGLPALSMNQNQALAAGTQRPKEKTESFCKEWEAEVGQQLAADVQAELLTTAQENEVRMYDGVAAGHSVALATMTGQDAAVATVNGDVASVNSAAMATGSSTVAAKEAKEGTAEGFRFAVAANLKKGTAADAATDATL